MQLSIMRSVARDPGGSVELRLVGSIDLGTRQALLDAAAGALSLSDALVIDAGGVDFVDSTGVGALITIGQMAEREHATFVVSRTSAQLQRILSVAGLDAHWHREAGDRLSTDAARAVCQD